MYDPHYSGNSNAVSNYIMQHRCLWSVSYASEPIVATTREHSVWLEGGGHA